MSLIERIHDFDKPPVIVAELSGNHRQDFDVAKKIIQESAIAGADAIKLQTYTPDSLALPIDKPEFRVDSGPWKGQLLYDLYQKACTPYEWHRPLKELADELGISLFSTPFDEEGVDFLEDQIDPEIYKVSSFELTHIPLLKKIARTAKPVILSTGMATESEIAEAIGTLKSNGCPDIILLKCVSSYPSDPKGFHLNSMQSLQQTFGYSVGLSDHCLTNEVALAATALGARVIEKHVTDDRNRNGVDSAFSLEPDELAEMIKQIKMVASSLGDSIIGKTDQDDAQTKYRRSIYVSIPIEKGETLSEKNLKIIRPALGLDPRLWKATLGKKASRDLEPGHALKAADIR